jgi:ElaB/YqjD/DUF883 family membrane-anchored ribosome-binding protein
VNEPKTTPQANIGDAAKSKASAAGASASDVIDDARDAVSEASGPAHSYLDELLGSVRQRAVHAIDERKNAGAQYVNGIARAIRAGAHELQSTTPEAGRYIEQAAEALERTAQTIESRSYGELIDDASTLVRRNPTAATLTAMTAGLLFARFLRAGEVSVVGASSSHASSNGGERVRTGGIGDIDDIGNYEDPVRAAGGLDPVAPEPAVVTAAVGETEISGDDAMQRSPGQTPVEATTRSILDGGPKTPGV